MTESLKKISELKAELKNKDDLVHDLESKVLSSQKECSKWKNKIKGKINKEQNLKRRTVVMDEIYHYSTDNQQDAVFVKAAEAVARHCYQYWWKNTKAKRVSDLLESGKLFSSQQFICEQFVSKAKNMTRTVFAPELVLRGVDMSSLGGGLKFSGCALYTHIKGLKKYERGFLFSKSSIVQAAKELEAEAKKKKQLCPHKRRR